MIKKRCKRCNKTFCAEKAEPFVTCSTCRKPLPGRTGGCTHWQGVDEHGLRVESYKGQRMQDKGM